jgi:8-oxo-dGTP pyrophosphatase MutT (NUDIX family)
VSLIDRFRSDPRIEQLAVALAALTPAEVHDPIARRAAVAILIRLGRDNQPELLFIRRAEYAGDPWSGHIAFPGGREERGDESLLDTAMRETFEETGIDLRGRAELLGVLHDLSPKTVLLPAVVVRPYVFVVGEIPELVLSSEVAGSFWVPLTALLDRSVWKSTMVRAGEVEMSRLAFHHEGNIVWGMTEKILSDLLELISP